MTGLSGAQLNMEHEHVCHVVDYVESLIGAVEAVGTKYLLLLGLCSICANKSEKPPADLKMAPATVLSQSNHISHAECTRSLIATKAILIV